MERIPSIYLQVFSCGIKEKKMLLSGNHLFPNISEAEASSGGRAHSRAGTSGIYTIYETILRKGVGSGAQPRQDEL